MEKHYITAWIARDEKDNEGNKSNKAYIYFRGEPIKNEKTGTWKGVFGNDGQFIDDSLFNYAINPEWNDERATRIKLEVHKDEDLYEKTYIDEKNNKIIIEFGSMNFTLNALHEIVNAIKISKNEKQTDYITADFDNNILVFHKNESKYIKIIKDILIEKFNFKLENFINY